MPPPAGSRGRARGRSRGGQQEESSRRPGGDAAPPAVPPAAEVASSGRAAHRGGMAERPGGGDVPVEQLQQLMLGEQRERSGRRDRFSYHDPATRPAQIVDKRGQSGESCNLVTNYYAVTSQPTWRLYQYHVDFSPQIDHIGIRKKLLRVHKEQLGNEYLFDGMILFSIRSIRVDENKKATMMSTRESDDAKIQLTLTFTKELNKDDPQCLQLYNILIRRSIKELGLQLIQRSHFDPQLSAKIQQHKMEVWPGYQTTIRCHDRGVLLCTELTFKVLSTETLLDKMYNWFHQIGEQNFHNEMQKKLIGSIVMTRHNIKTYRIDDIEWDKRVTDTFKKGDTEMTYQQYFKDQYGIVLGDPNQPLLLHRPKKREQRKTGKGEVGAGPEEERIIYLPPELCTLTGIPDEMRADYRVMNDLAQHTRLPPDKRMAMCDTLLQRFRSNANVQDLWKAWNVDLSETHMEMPARVLAPETINQGAKKYNYRSTEADWTREMRDAKMDIAQSLDNWMVVTTRRDMQTTQSFVNSLSRVAPPLGIQVAQPNVVAIEQDRLSAYVDALKQNVQPDTRMVMVILSNNRKDRYDAVKTLLCCQIPVASQCVIAKTVANPKKVMSVATKVAIQMNCKMGGAAWSVTIPLKGLMVCGVDTYHDSAEKGRSVGAFVASFNPNCTRYYSKTLFQTSKQEMLDGLRLCAASAIKNYHHHNQAFPSTIVVYRDGVGDGQLAHVFEKEVPDVRRAFQDVAPSVEIKVAFVVVTKRITTRFFQKNGGGQIRNPPAGTVIDQAITKPERYDFYIVSQSVRQGSVSPTSYNVIYDDSGFKPEHMQRLAYKMTHLYYNWPGTVRVPAPCMYAHKLAFLTGQSLHQEPSEVLADRLFFI